jgi:hypothetical protein
MRFLLNFFSLTFIISWSLFIAAAIISRNAHSPDSGFSPFGYFIYLIGVFAPALVALFLSWRKKKMRECFHCSVKYSKHPLI